MTADSVTRVDVAVAQVTPRTAWIFVEVEAASGLRGTGEATLSGREAKVLARLDALAPALLGAPASPAALPAALPSCGDAPDLPLAAALSALDQALWDIAAARDRVPLAEALGGARRDAVPLYANINRRTLDRSPEGFAASARAALAAGHAAVKIAPFDEATPEARATGALAAALAPGLARIAAVRDAIGPGRRLMVDCHWRLDEAAAAEMIAATAPCRLHWLECPLPETADNLPSLRRLRRAANRHGALLAGCEENIGIDGFAAFLRAECYDVMMPDVKYVGALGDMLDLARLMADAGVAFSPHNPSGPIAHAASLQVAAAADNLSMLECQFDETPWFDALASPKPSPPTAGAVAPPRGPGLGVALDREALAGCPGARRTFTPATRHAGQTTMKRPKGG